MQGSLVSFIPIWFLNLYTYSIMPSTHLNKPKYKLTSLSSFSSPIATEKAKRKDDSSKTSRVEDKCIIAKIITINTF